MARHVARRQWYAQRRVLLCILFSVVFTTQLEQRVDSFEAMPLIKTSWPHIVGLYPPRKQDYGPGSVHQPSRN